MCVNLELWIRAVVWTTYVFTTSNNTKGFSFWFLYSFSRRLSWHACYVLLRCFMLKGLDRMWCVSSRVCVLWVAALRIKGSPRAPLSRSCTERSLPSVSADAPLSGYRSLILPPNLSGLYSSDGFQLQLDASKWVNCTRNMVRFTPERESQL